MLPEYFFQPSRVFRRVQKFLVMTSFSVMPSTSSSLALTPRVAAECNSESQRNARRLNVRGGQLDSKADPKSWKRKGVDRGHVSGTATYPARRGEANGTKSHTTNFGNRTGRCVGIDTYLNCPSR